jgi:TMEM175 potassium channel family protein
MTTVDVRTEPPPVQDELPLGRLDAFSDAVFAIAITLLVLELGVGEGAADHLLRSLVHEWPAYLAYVTSFLTIGVVWLQHSEITGALRTADATLYRLNLLVLLLASFLPFPTRLASEFIGDRDPERIAVVFYGLTLVALTLALTAFLRYATEKPQLVKDSVEARTVERALLRAPSLVLYAVGIAVGLVLPTAGIGVYFVSALSRGLPARTVHRLLWRREN